MIAQPKAVWISRVCLALSAALFVAITVIYAARWDFAAALTLYPFWCWAIVGLLLVAFGHACHRTKAAFGVAVLWFAASFVFADGIAPLFRGLTFEKHRSNGTYRIVSLNCAGTADAANEVVAFKPDVVLLQEVPGTNQVAILARRLFGTNGCYVSGFDCAIIARCPLTLSRKHDPYYASAVVQLGPVPVLVTSLRLVPPETRSDLWNPDAWRAYIENRQQRMRQLTALMGSVREHAGPQAIGGDFNAPGGDAVFSLLQGYQDTYATAGRGWGHTALNNIPFVRPDQIWVKALRPRSARAVKTVHSDHRMVVGDIELFRP